MSRPADVGVKRSLWRRVADFVAGADEEWLVRPTGVAADGQRVYVADPGARALWILDPAAGEVRRVREATGGALASPVAVAIGPRGLVFVADSERAEVLAYDAGGAPAGTAARAGLRRPAGLAYDAARDRLYVADSAAHRIAVFASDGRPLGTLGRRGTGPGEFNFPTHLALDREGRLLVTDSLNFRLQALDAEGAFQRSFGLHGDASGEFASPKGVALDSAGHVYVVEALFDAVQIFDRSGRYLLAFGERGTAPGQFSLPGGVSIDGKDRIYVADSYNQRIQVFQYLRGAGDE
jgi:DNA-binding beta-propeller fold protein YncE